MPIPPRPHLQAWAAACAGCAGCTSGLRRALGQGARLPTVRNLGRAEGRAGQGLPATCGPWHEARGDGSDGAGIAGHLPQRFHTGAPRGPPAWCSTPRCCRLVHGWLEGAPPPPAGAPRAPRLPVACSALGRGAEQERQGVCRRGERVLLSGTTSGNAEASLHCPPRCPLDSGDAGAEARCGHPSPTRHRRCCSCRHARRCSFRGCPPDSNGRGTEDE
mmetsp:Transcript_129301/g.335268  ORF Transcript_129301/g.335268 Transcript_129301/m.335268 type:complete len:218 (+) Transcript_129301:1192-1845(+)